MMPERRVPLEDDPCPISDEMLGQIYRASPNGLSALIELVAPAARALLAVYCYRRAHLASIGLVIAATCNKDDLTALAGNTGDGLFEKSQEARPASISRVNGRRKINLSKGPLRQPSPIEDEQSAD